MINSIDSILKVEKQTNEMADDYSFVKTTLEIVRVPVE